jgi:hypothetical protein
MEEKSMFCLEYKRLEEKMMASIYDKLEKYPNKEYFRVKDCDKLSDILFDGISVEAENSDRELHRFWIVGVERVEDGLKFMGFWDKNLSIDGIKHFDFLIPAQIYRMDALALMADEM